jgi:hypothetical protein
MVAMTQPTSTDPRSAVEYRIPARTLRAGDVVNTAPGGEDDWQEVRAVYTQGSLAAATEQIAELIATIGDRYVLVEMSDIAPVDANVYFTETGAYVYGEEGADPTVTEAVGDGAGERTYLYTVHELVTVRAATT